jgi:mRNA-degrading endonuclease RelE of RelBE toxin-antitoxin system
MPSEYEVELIESAREGFAGLDKSDQILVTKQLEKLKRAPQLGVPLGNKMGYDLTGCYKLYAARKRIRIIYEIEDNRLIVTVIAIGAREAARVYAIADAEMGKRRLRRIS